MNRSGSSADQYVEVYDEPLHRVQMRNEYALVYSVQIPRGVETLWHRHTEDTVYCAIRDVEVGETLPDQGWSVRHTVCGTAMSRAHRKQPLIHRVTNVGQDLIHFVAAEAHTRPPLVQAMALLADGHQLVWETTRFRAYQVAAAGVAAVEYAFYALFVALTPTTLELERVNDSTHSTRSLAIGEWVWLEPTMRVQFAGAVRGILAEWR